MKDKKIHRKIHTKIFAGILLFCLVFACSCTPASKSLRIGTGNPEGTYYSYVGEFATLAGNDLSVSRTQTAGTVASIRLLQKGFVDGAITQNDLLYDAINGTGNFTGENTKNNLNFSAVAGLYTESLQVVTTADSGIESIEDLKGKRVSVGEEESGVIQNAAQILPVYGLTFADLDCRNLSFSDSSKALSEGEIDAFFCMAGAPTQAISNCAKDTSLRLISLNDPDIDKILNLYPYYVKCTIPGGTYEGIDEDVNTVGVRAIFVVSNSRSREEVKLLTEKLIQHSAALNAGITTDGKTDLLEATKDVSIPFHPGAASYYSDNGITVPESKGRKTVLVYGSQDR